MAYDERLDQDVSAIVAGWGNVDRKRMFGGVNIRAIEPDIMLMRAEVTGNIPG